MSEAKEIRDKNLVYLMIRRYNGDCGGSFPSDMDIDPKYCEKIFKKYSCEVLSEIENEDIDEDGVPTADELINKGLKRLKVIVSSTDDPSKLTRSIEILTQLRDSGVVKRELHETIFDKIQKGRKDEN